MNEKQSDTVRKLLLLLLDRIRNEAHPLIEDWEYWHFKHILDSPPEER